MAINVSFKPVLLFYKYHLHSPGEIIRHQLVEIYPARRSRCIPFHAVGPGCHGLVHECCHLAAKHVEHIQRNLTCGRYRKADVRCWIEWVRIVLF